MKLAINARNRLTLLNLTIASPDIANKCRAEVSNHLSGSDYIVFTYYNETITRRQHRPPSWSFSRANWTEFPRIADRKLAELPEADAERTSEEFNKHLISTYSFTITCTKPCAKALVV